MKRFLLIMLVLVFALGASQIVGAQEEEEPNLIDCDALVLVYGETSPTWVRAQLRLFRKMTSQRERDLKLLAICAGPPSEKPDLGVSLPGMRIVECCEKGDLSPLSPLVEELGG